MKFLCGRRKDESPRHKEYVIARALSPLELTDRVNALIKLGWQAHGGLAVPLFDFGDDIENGGDSGVYYQTMVK